MNGWKCKGMLGWMHGWMNESRRTKETAHRPTNGRPNQFSNASFPFPSLLSHQQTVRQAGRQTDRQSRKTRRGGRHIGRNKEEQDKRTTRMGFVRLGVDEPTILCVPSFLLPLICRFFSFFLSYSLSFV
mmetsp:Transcript_35359/g.69788  ORF Transcript_35359/g.69788 Transcript_35359/m.69788 type:complete len:129 (-) Transcript_35359:2121-2507(-)